MEIYLWISFFLSVFFILTIFWHALKAKKRKKSTAFMAVEIIFVMLILLGMLIVNKTSLEYQDLLETAKSHIYQGANNEETNHNQSTKDNSESDLINKLISMQANTLSVTVTIVTISCIIISILTIYRERKSEVNNQKVEASLNMLKKTESIIQEIAAISSVLLLNDNQKDFFISVFKDEVERLSSNKESLNIATAHFQMIMLNIILNDQYYMPKNIEETKKYDIIINSANKIIESDDATHLSVSLAYVERAHAAYQRLKTSTDTKDVEQIQNNMKQANEYICYLKNFADDSGNVLNLNGLIELWTGIAKTRINEITKNSKQYSSKNCLKHYRTAFEYFEKAIKANNRKKEFKNHKIVALLRISDVCDDSKKLDELGNAIKLCKNLFEEAPNYIKPCINYVDAIARKIRFKLKPELIWNDEAERHIFDYSKLDPQNELSQQEITELRTEALNVLEKTIKIDSGFPNSYYKRTEINLLWLGYNLWLHDNGKVCSTFDDMSKVYSNCEKDLSDAKTRIGTPTKIVGYEMSLGLIYQKLRDVEEIPRHTKKRQRGKKRK